MLRGQMLYYDVLERFRVDSYFEFIKVLMLTRS